MPLVPQHSLTQLADHPTIIVCSLSMIRETEEDTESHLSAPYKPFQQREVRSDISTTYVFLAYSTFVPQSVERIARGPRLVVMQGACSLI